MQRFDLLRPIRAGDGVAEIDWCPQHILRIVARCKRQLAAAMGDHMNLHVVKEFPEPIDTKEQARDQLLISISRTLMRQNERLAALEGRAAITEAELAEFRAIADVFARFIGEAKS